MTEPFRFRTGIRSFFTKNAEQKTSYGKKSYKYTKHYQNN